LKRIITSFTISVNFAGVSQGTASTASLGGGNSSSSSGVVVPAGQIGGRASGGPVIGGQSYKVFDTHQDEILRLGASGRIDPMSASSQPQRVIILNWDDFDIPTLASEIVKAQNNA